MREGARGYMSRALQWLDTVVEWLTVLLTACLVVIVSTNVFARYVLRSGLLWAEEASRLIFVWVVFLGAYVALNRGAHLSVTFVTDRLPPREQRVVRTTGLIMVMVFLGIVMWHGTVLVLRTFEFGRVTPILGLSAAWGYLSVPLTMALMLQRLLRELITGQ